MTNQITQAKLKDLNVIKLYEHYAALEKSLPLLTPESQELAKAELEACAHLRSEKVDRIYYAIAAHEDALERTRYLRSCCAGGTTRFASISARARRRRRETSIAGPENPAA